MEFLTHVTITVPTHVAPQELEQLKRAEGERARALVCSGSLIRLWRPATTGWENIGLWSASDQDALHRLLETLPLFPYMEIKVTALYEHPNDPARQ